MTKKYEIKLDYKKIQAFYSSLRFTRFEKISKNRRDFLDILIKLKKDYMKKDTTNMASLATSTAAKIIRGNEKYDFQNSDESAYFYINIVDPDLEVLETSREISDKEKLKAVCKEKFGFYDNALIFLESCYDLRIKQNDLNGIWSKESINMFYHSLEFTNFINLKPERIQAIDSLVEKQKKHFYKNTRNLFMRAASSADKLINEENFGLVNGDEIAYFYIKMVDPDFQLLEAYESFCNFKEMRTVCNLNFGIYDYVLIQLEKSFNDRFNLYTSEELWTRNTLKRTRS